MTAYLNTNCCRATKSEVKQYKVGLLLFDEPPILNLVRGCSDNLSLGNLVTHNTLGTLQFQRNVFYDNKLKVFHISVMLYESL